MKPTSWKTKNQGNLNMYSSSLPLYWLLVLKSKTVMTNSRGKKTG